MYNNVPSLKDSNSIVALSVSISARMSPSTTVSPTFFNQVATVPSVIVSLKRGIVTTTTPFGSDVAAAGAAVSSFFASAATGAVSAGAAAAGFPANKAEISSPSLPMIAKRLSTGAVSPSGIPICNRVPSLKDSNSIVALSVSISARISPSLILSPTFFSQVATVPSVIVSLKRGMVIIVAILIYSL
ncbi:hypothetical protein D3C80_1211340 [compost metagenome]